MAHRRVSFIFENDVNAVDRVAALEEVVRRVPGTSNYVINHFRTGPRNESRLSKASYVQFIDTDDRARFLIAAGGKNT
eukprot:14866849-Alexandrium_andersonii.AAC.1